MQRSDVRSGSRQTNKQTKRRETECKKKKAERGASTNQIKVDGKREDEERTGCSDRVGGVQRVAEVGQA